MNAKDIGTLAMIAGVGAAALAADSQRHPHGQSVSDVKSYRKRRNKKKRMAKTSKKQNRC